MSKILDPYGYLIIIFIVGGIIAFYFQATLTFRKITDPEPTSLVIQKTNDISDYTYVDKGFLINL